MDALVENVSRARSQKCRAILDITRDLPINQVTFYDSLDRASLDLSNESENVPSFIGELRSYVETRAAR